MVLTHSLPNPPGSPADLSGGIAAIRAFGTWSPAHPAAMVWLPLGISVMPVAYAGSINTATSFPVGSGLRLGRHTVDASIVEVGMDHAGTRLVWTWTKPDPFTARGNWTTVEHGEWGLRFWVCLALGGPDGTQWHWDDTQGVAHTRIGHRWAVVAPDRAPLMVTGHANLDSLTDELETHGYFFLESRMDTAPLMALRFNLEEMPAASFGFAIGDDLEETTIRGASSAPNPVPDGDVRLAAVRDVMAWNTIFDPINRRPYTALSRNWTTAKFGGFGVWLNDVLLSALLCSMTDPEAARDNLLAVAAGATPQGNLPCLLTGNDAWIDRSQPPIAAFVLAMHVARWPDAALVARMLPVLLANWNWWWRERDPTGTGLVRYGTSAIGHGLYRGTKLGAKDESGMDNSPIHDPAMLGGDGMLGSHDVGLNALLALEGEMLCDLMQSLGQNADAVHSRTAALKDRIRDYFWDSKRGVFANRLLNGQFVDSLAPTSFYPMIAGIPTAEQTAALLVQMDDPHGFGGPRRLPSVRRDDPAFGGAYWRGRVWPPMNWITWAGLRRIGQDDRAAALAAESWTIFRGPWEANRHAAENFAPDADSPSLSADTDSFYSWSALMPAMAVAEVADVTPWDGFTLTNGADVDIGPLATPVGPCRIHVAGGILRLIRQGRVLLETDIPGRFSRVRLEPSRIHLTLPQNAPAGRILLACARPLSTTQAGIAIGCTVGDGRITLTTRPPVDASREIDVILA